MKYAVLGTGMVGHSLAGKLIDLGHEVRMEVRGDASTDPVVDDLAQESHALALVLRQQDSGGLVAVHVFGESVARRNRGRDARLEQGLDALDRIGA